MSFNLFIYDFLTLIQIVCVIGIIANLLFILNSFITRKAPCVFMPKEVIPEIVKALDLNKSSILYDLGSGDGRIVFALHRETPDAKLTGIDISPFLTAYTNSLKNKLKSSENIHFINDNIMRADLGDATHIFAYLFPEFMIRLLPKMEKELKPGTIFVSCDFPFTGKKPIKTIDLGRKETEKARYLYIYKF